MKSVVKGKNRLGTLGIFLKSPLDTSIARLYRGREIREGLPC